MSIVTCPRCDAQWVGLKIEHCPGGRHNPDCHLTFSSTQVADAHLVDMDADGWSRHLTMAEMLALRNKNTGEPRYTARVNQWGTAVIGRPTSDTAWIASRHESERPTGEGAGDTS